MSIDEKAASYIELARDDIAAARDFLSKHPRATAPLIEQAAEKLLKAILTTEGIVFPPTHQIGMLADLLPEGHLWSVDFKALDSLTRYATAYRYPTANGRVPVAPNREELKRNLDTVGNLVDEVEDWCEEARK